MKRNYPRPQLYRENVMLLDGKWRLDEQEVNVPYPPQSELSGYVGDVPDEFTYARVFSVDELNFSDDSRFILHFGAVDQIAKVYLNSILLGEHISGYLSFEFDITDVISRDGINKLEVEVTDKLDVTYPYGKQCKKPHSMWYTPTSGIWKSVFIEVVPSGYVSNIRITPTDSLCRIGFDVSDVDMPDEVSSGDMGLESATVNVYEGVVLSSNEYDLYKYISEDRLIYSKNNANDLIIDKDVISDYLGKPYELKLWDEYAPTLYPIEIIYKEDKVYSYMAFRNISIKHIDECPSVCLNEKPIFLHGVLDQGYFKDGNLTPKENKEYDRDILRMKRLGFNTLRKHIKIEPDYFYFACDRLGMYVIQDMVNSGDYSFARDTLLPTFGMKYKKDNLLSGVDTKRKEFFVQHCKDTIGKIYNFPSILCYTIFNEGWGQFEADKLYDILKKEDDTRLYDSTSGWFHQTKSDFDSEHVYFKNKTLCPKNRPLLLSECGGYSFKADGENNEKSYGYGACPNENALTYKICEMYEEMVYPAIKQGMCGCIYTQLSDVENEINGLYTYDRKRRKVIKKKMLDIRAKIDEEIADKWKKKS